MTQSLPLSVIVGLPPKVGEFLGCFGVPFDIEQAGRWSRHAQLWCSALSPRLKRLGWAS